MRHHGRNARIYLQAVNGTGNAVPISSQNSWSINQATDKQDVTAFGDSNKVYVAGLPDSSGDFSGFLDESTSQTFVAATDGLPRSFYLYPDIVSNPNNWYWMGQILVDGSADGSVSGAINFKASWNAASAISRYTPLGLNT